MEWESKDTGDHRGELSVCGIGFGRRGATFDSSPAFQRRVCFCRAKVPQGRLKMGHIPRFDLNFSRPFGTGGGWGPNPAMNRRAIVGQPSGLGTAERRCVPVGHSGAKRQASIDSTENSEELWP